ncbi:MAG TPA: hypothetical protein VGB59_10055 [Allosphingosinicella sp.]|jgi:hypothetical protein
MARRPRNVDEVLARFDEYSARLDGHTPSPMAQRVRRGAGTATRRLAGAAAAVFVLFTGIFLFSQLIVPIGAMGFLGAVVFAAIVAGMILLRPAREPKRVEYREDLPTGTVLKQLESLLSRRRDALPAPAARRADAIAAQVPLLESRLSELDPLDPLAQDARRLMGKHLPELIDRYEKVPAAYRGERDGDGLTVDERLVASLDAANQALGDIGSRLAKSDRDAFETQGRFIESRYKDSGKLQGE